MMYKLLSSLMTKLDSAYLIIPMDNAVSLPIGQLFNTWHLCPTISLILYLNISIINHELHKKKKN